MTVAELRIILEHVPGHLPVRLPRGVECWEVRRVTEAPWVPACVVLDEHRAGGTRFERIGLRGRFSDAKTLRLRLDALERGAA